MARYFLRFRHADTGLTPTFTTWKRASDLSPAAPSAPTIVEVTSPAIGTYFFDVTPTYDILFEVDGGAAITDNEIRYISDTISPKDVYVDIPVSFVADAVWDEVLAGHLTAGTTGEKLSTGASGGGATAGDIADAVWDEVLAGHLTAGTTGAKLSAGSSGGGGGAYVTFTSNGDTIAPIVVQVASPKTTQVRVTFSEPVVMTSAANGALRPLNYTIPGLTVVSVQALTAQQVLLTTSAQVPDFLYDLTITGVEDLQGNPIA